MNNDMGNLIANLRKKNNMTQQELANKLNITDKAVSKWERGFSCPDISTIPQLAEILGIDANQLLACNSSNNNKSNKDETFFNKAILNLIFKSVGMALGVACFVLSVLGKLEVDTGFKLISLAVALLAISLLELKTKSNIIFYLVWKSSPQPSAALIQFSWYPSCSCACWIKYSFTH